MDAEHPTRDTLVERKVEEVHVLAVELKRTTDKAHAEICKLREEIAASRQTINELSNRTADDEQRIRDLQAALVKQRAAYNEQSVILADTILGCAQR